MTEVMQHESIPKRYLSGAFSLQFEHMILSLDKRVQSLPQNVLFFVDIKQMEH